MRPKILAGLGLVVLALLVGACGEDEDPSPPPAPVRLALDAPRDTAVVQNGSITVRGSVSPASAQVQVRGERTEVSGGRFRARVALELGTNVIDVMASAPGTSPAFAAVRVTREETVRVPDLAGASAEEAGDQLSALGLRAKVERKGGIIEDLLPGDGSVCESTPAAGTKVPKDSTVTVRVGKLC